MLIITLARAAAYTVAFGVKFHSAMKQSLDIMGANQGHFRLMEEAAKSLSEATVFSAAQSAEYLYVIASAGLDTDRFMSELANSDDEAIEAMLCLAEKRLESN